MSDSYDWAKDDKEILKKLEKEEKPLPIPFHDGRSCKLCALVIADREAGITLSQERRDQLQEHFEEKQ